LSFVRITETDDPILAIRVDDSRRRGTRNGGSYRFLLPRENFEAAGQQEERGDTEGERLHGSPTSSRITGATVHIVRSIFRDRSGWRWRIRINLPAVRTVSPLASGRVP
jgi:hypothetical protein